jgi:hypothetical protein
MTCCLETRYLSQRPGLSKHESISALGAVHRCCDSAEPTSRHLYASSSTSPGGQIHLSRMFHCPQRDTVPRNGNARQAPSSSHLTLLAFQLLVPSNIKKPTMKYTHCSKGFFILDSLKEIKLY